MHFHVLTLFPEMIEAAFSTSITGRAVQAGHLSLDAVNIRDFAEEKRKSRVDDYSYGGGAGMIMQAEPVYRAYQSVIGKIRASGYPEGAGTEAAQPEAEELPFRKPRVLFMSPQGRRFDQAMAAELAQEEDLIFLCGHYEGIDQRVLDEIVTDEVSAGDYVLTGGELPALIMMDAVSRLVPGVLSNEDSAQTESFMGDGLLEYPQYSRPEEWHGRKVPEVLLSGNHGAVERWRREQSLLRTAQKRQDLCREAVLNKKDRKYIRENGLEELYRGARNID